MNQHKENDSIQTAADPMIHNATSNAVHPRKTRSKRLKLAALIASVCVCTSSWLTADDGAGEVSSDDRINLSGLSEKASIDLPVNWTETEVLEETSVDFTKVIDVWASKKTWAPSPNWPPKPIVVEKASPIAEYSGIPDPIREEAESIEVATPRLPAVKSNPMFDSGKANVAAKPVNDGVVSEDTAVTEDVAKVVKTTPHQTEKFQDSLRDSLSDLSSGQDDLENSVLIRRGRTPYSESRFMRSLESTLESFGGIDQQNVAAAEPPPSRLGNRVEGSFAKATLDEDVAEKVNELKPPAADATKKTVQKAKPAKASPAKQMEKKPAASVVSSADKPHNPQANCGQPRNAAPYHYNDFSPTPVDQRAVHSSAARERFVYDSKPHVPVQRPLIEWPRKWYSDGITPPGIDVFGHKNLLRPKFYVYGDFRSGIQGGRNAAGRADNLAKRLNLDFDLQLTDSDRWHMFINPLEDGGRNTRVELIGGDLEFESEFDITPANLFYEGDLGVWAGAARGKTSPREIPVAAGLVPLLFQNGIWMEDAASGVATAIPARHSRLLNISNMDLTFFALFDQLNSAAFDDEHSAQAFGTAAFIEAYGGYIEAGYAFLNDRNNDDRDYHNATVSFTKRYFDRISNSVRLIVNAGQDGPDAMRTADGGILLVENSWITAKPLTVIPYANFFYGWDRPQSVARAGGSGGLLRSTGINFQSDGLNGFSFLDDTGIDTAGGAIGVDLIGDQLDRQLIVEAAYQTPHGGKNPNVPEDQFAVGGRFQINLTNWTLLRFDSMYGWRRGLEDIYGTRAEFRWKF